MQNPKIKSDFSCWWSVFMAEPIIPAKGVNAFDGRSFSYRIPSWMKKTMSRWGGGSEEHHELRKAEM